MDYQPLASVVFLSICNNRNSFFGLTTLRSCCLWVVFVFASRLSFHECLHLGFCYRPFKRIFRSFSRPSEMSFLCVQPGMVFRRNFLIILGGPLKGTLRCATGVTAQMNASNRVSVPQVQPVTECPENVFYRVTVPRLTEECVKLLNETQI